MRWPPRTVRSLQQARYVQLCRDLIAAVQDIDPDTGPYRAAAALAALLASHPIDARGRCRSCRRPGRWSWVRRRRICMVYEKAHYWLRQPGTALRAHPREELLPDLAHRASAESLMLPTQRDQHTPPPD